MSVSQTHALRALIEDSVLLSPKRKSELLTQIESLMEPQAQKLLHILQSEDHVLKKIAEHAIKQAVKNGDEEFLKDLDLFLHDATKSLRKGQEGAERTNEQTNIESMFDDTL